MRNSWISGSHCHNVDISFAISYSSNSFIIALTLSDPLFIHHKMPSWFVIILHSDVPIDLYRLSHSLTDILIPHFLEELPGGKVDRVYRNFNSIELQFSQFILHFQSFQFEIRAPGLILSVISCCFALFIITHPFRYIVCDGKAISTPSSSSNCIIFKLNSPLTVRKSVHTVVFVKQYMYMFKEYSPKSVNFTI